jgi:hypothetical protein
VQAPKAVIPNIPVINSPIFILLPPASHFSGAALAVRSSLVTHLCAAAIEHISVLTHFLISKRAAGRVQGYRI